MLTLICYALAAILFLLAGTGQDIFDQPAGDEIAFGLMFTVIGLALNGVWRPGPWTRGA